MKLLINDLKKVPLLIIYFALYAFGIWLTKEAYLGMGPWNCFNEGLANYINLSFGQLSQLIGIVLLVFAMLFRMYPGIGTLINIFFIGYFFDLIDANLDFESTNIILRLLLSILGCLVISVAFVLYVRLCLGQGPRDSVNQGVYISFKKKFHNLKYGYVKFTVEGIALFVGILLGGTYGVGTILSLVLTSFFTQQILNIIKLDPKNLINRNFKSYI